jgi:hypothetical protein
MPQVLRSSRISAILRAWIVNFTSRRRTGKINIAFELAEGAADLFAGTIAIAERVFAQRHALGIGADAVANFLSNIGTAQNVTTATNATVGRFDVQAMYTALPSVYRKSAVIICNDSVRSLITASYEAAARSMIGPVSEVLRKKIFVRPSMPTFSAGQAAFAIIYDRNYLIQRRVKSGTFVRKYKEAVGAIEFGLTCVEGFSRCEVQPP